MQQRLLKIRPMDWLCTVGLNQDCATTSVMGLQMMLKAKRIWQGSSVEHNSGPLRRLAY